MLCSKLHYQKGFNLILDSYKIRVEDYGGLVEEVLKMAQVEASIWP